MKLLRQKLLLTATCLCYLLPSTAQDEIFKHIPERTAQIMKIDLQHLQQFMKWEEIQQLPVFNRMPINTRTPGIAEAIKNPSVTGIDLQSAVYVLLHQSAERMEGFNGVAGRIRDLQQFTTWALDLNKAIALTKTGRVKTIVKKDLAFIWDTEYFVIINDPYSRFRRFQNDSISSKFRRFSNDSILSSYVEKMPEESIITEITKTFEDNTPMPVLDSRMKELFSQPAPVTVWNRNYTFDKLLSLFNPARMMAMATGKREKNTSTSILNFDNGRAYYTSRSYFDEKLDRLFSGKNKIPFDMELAKHIDLEKSIGFAALKINMQSLGQFFDGLHDKEEMLEKMKRNGTDPVDVFSAFTGDVLITGTPADKLTTRAIPGIVAALKINNMVAARRLFGKWNTGMEDKDRKRTYLRLDAAKQLLVIASNEGDADRFINAAFPDQDKELTEQIKANPFFLRVNINALYDEMLRLQQPKGDKEKLIASIFSSLQHFKITAGKYENGALLFDYELGFANKEDNGFRQTVLFYDKLIGFMMDVTHRPEEREVQVIVPPQELTEEIKIGTIIQEGVVDVPPPPPPPPPPVMRKHPPNIKLKVISPAETKKIIKKKQ